MRVLMTAAAHGRIAQRLAPSAEGLEIILLEGKDRFLLNGAPIDKADVEPEVVWMSSDCFEAGQIPALFGRLLQSPAVKWGQMFFAGLDNPIYGEILSRGVRLTKSDAQSVPIAEYVVAHGLALLLPLARQAQLQGAREWADTPWREVGHTRWTLVGFGGIGREIAARLRPFGPHVTVVRRKADAPTPGVDAVVAEADLKSVLPDSDVVVLACPLTPATRGMADQAFFAAMKPGAILINIARGGLVDEDALRAALDGPLAAAVLDVFQTEPLPADHWAWSHPKVKVSAHTSWAGDGVVPRGDVRFLENLRRYRAGEPLLNEASRKALGLED